MMEWTPQINMENIKDIMMKRKDGSMALSVMQKYPSFEEYYKMIPKEKRDTSSYDLRAYYKANPKEAMEFIKKGTHAPDTYKLPNHITFSNESIYHSYQTPGGRWAFENGKDVFYASPINIKNAGGVDKLKAYFYKNEPGVNLIIPK